MFIIINDPASFKSLLGEVYNIANEFIIYGFDRDRYCTIDTLRRAIVHVSLQHPFLEGFL